MNAILAWDNVVAYSLQVGLLVGVGAAVPALLGMHLPKARLAYLHLVLAACLLLPLARPWKRALVTVTTPAAAALPASAAPAMPAPHPRTEWPLSQMGLLVLAAGVVARAGWLAVGLGRLRRYQRRSTPWGGPAVALGPRPEYRLSGDVSSPVTFGWRSPVVLLPLDFERWAPAAQEAVLCHEALHVERGDWALTVVEELVRALFWFHPAIWWLLGEIQLAREQAVDREVVERTQARDQYLDALLAVAGAGAQFDLAPAPLFLRKRHLKYRVMAVVKELHMSRTRLVSTMALGLAVLAAGCWFATAAFPLAAEPQMVVDGTGVTVELSGAELLHRTPVRYPAAAAAKGVQGTVTVQVRLGTDGTVVDASVVSGPDELRKAVLESVLGWHFAKDAAGGTRTVTVSFQLPVQTPASQAAAGVPNPPGQMVPGDSRMVGTHIGRIEVRGLSERARGELLAALPIHVGDAYSSEAMVNAAAAARAFDEHLRMTWVGGSGQTNVTFAMMDAPAVEAAPALAAAPTWGTGSPVEAPGVPQRVQIGGAVQATLLEYGPRPEYPPIAKQARITGVVHLRAFISKEGAVQSLTVIPPAHPLLAPAAMEAVRQWRYKPTMLNGQPVEVETTIDVSFALEL